MQATESELLAVVITLIRSRMTGHVTATSARSAATECVTAGALIAGELVEEAVRVLNFEHLVRQHGPDIGLNADWNCSTHAVNKRASKYQDDGAGYYLCDAEREGDDGAPEWELVFRTFNDDDNDDFDLLCSGSLGFCLEHVEYRGL